MSSHRLLVFLSFVAIAACTFNGDLVSWNRHPYLVKVLTRDVESKNISTCTGTLISPSSVLTSSQCFPGQISKLESQAIVALRGTSKTMNRAMLDVMIHGDIAIMRINPLPEKNFFEKFPLPPKASRLNMKPTLTEATFKPVDVNDLEMFRCRVIGFQTNDEVENFSTSDKVEIVDVELRNTNETLMFSEIFSNSTGSACWDDLGAPLECALAEENHYTQVGFVHKVYASGLDDEMAIGNATCADVKSTEYIVFGDLSLAEAIESADLSGVFMAQERYFHRKI